MQIQSPLVTTLYAQMQELVFADLARSFEPTGGGRPVQREIGGRTYWYWSGRVGGPTPRSLYLGPDDQATRGLVARMESARSDARDARGAVEDAARAFVAAGGMAHQAAHVRIFEHLARAGLFRKGVFVIGSHAFVALGNLLGVRWDGASAATLDLDLGRAESVALAIPVERDLHVDVPEALRVLDKTFAPVPGLDPRQPSTTVASYRSRVRVDFVTVQRKGRTEPVFFPDLNVAAQPLPFLDYLLGGDPARGLLVGRYPIPAPLPDPARYAFHKLVVSQSRDTTHTIKARKDLLQAAELLRALRDLAPTTLAPARAALAEIPGARRRLAAALVALDAMDSEAAKLARGT